MSTRECLVKQPLKTAYPSLSVLRTWRRDGSQNRMTVEAAGENLFRNCKEKRSRAALIDALLKGEVLYTPLAFFRLSSVDIN